MLVLAASSVRFMLMKMAVIKDAPKEIRLMLIQGLWILNDDDDDVLVLASLLCQVWALFDSTDLDDGIVLFPEMLGSSRANERNPDEPPFDPSSREIRLSTCLV